MNTHTFTVKWKNPSSGLIEEGQFTSKKLSIRDIGQMGTRRAQLCGGMHCVRDDEGNPTGQGIDEETDYVNRMIAHLEISLVQKPVWFKLDEIWDQGLLTEVFGKVVEFENTFKSTVYGGASGAGGLGQAGGGGNGPQANTGNQPTPVVGAQVQASLDA